MTTAQPIIDRIWMRTMPIPFSGCLVWMGRLDKYGYGTISLGGSRQPRSLVHRVAYEIVKGPIPIGMTLDHKCRVRSCWNPEHLEPVTNRVNILRGISFSAINYRKTHCNHGHEFSVENTYLWGRSRICRACVNRRSRQYYKRTRRS